MQNAPDASSAEPATKRAFIVSHDPIEAPPGLEACVAVIGNFDGLHRGHLEVIGHGRALARRLGRPCAVLTFEPHPADFFARRPVVFRLTPEAVKVRILDDLGLDGMIVLRFDGDLARLSADAFIEQILVRRLGVSGVVVGFDFHFGARREGTAQLLAEAGHRDGFAVEIVEKVATGAESGREAVHSTAARAALREGDVARAASLLGRRWFVQGKVRHGSKLGRRLGFPTANLVLDPSCELRRGIYAVRVSGPFGLRGGVASFGSRPTFDDGPLILEVYLFDFDGDLYDLCLKVEFVGWIRPEEKFADAEALVERMRLDAKEARRLLSSKNGPAQTPA